MVLILHLTSPLVLMYFFCSSVQGTAMPVNQGQFVRAGPDPMKPQAMGIFLLISSRVGASPYSLNSQWQYYSCCLQKKPNTGYTSSSCVNVRWLRCGEQLLTWPIPCGQLTLLLTSQLLTTLCYLKAVRCFLWLGVNI